MSDEPRQKDPSAVALGRRAGAKLKGTHRLLLSAHEASRILRWSEAYESEGIWSSADLELRARIDAWRDRVRGPR